MYAVVMEAHVHGISTHSVDDPVEATGGTGVSKSEVSRICAGHLVLAVTAGRRDLTPSEEGSRQRFQLGPGETRTPQSHSIKLSPTYDQIRLISSTTAIASQ